MTFFDANHIDPNVEKLQQIAKSEENTPTIESIVYSDGGFEIWIGSFSNALKAKENMKYQAIINVAVGDVWIISHPGSIKCLSIQAIDAEGYDILSHYDQIHDFLEGCRKEELRVLVHCAQGVNRSVALVVAYLMRITRKDAYEVVEQIASTRPGVLSNYSFCEKLLKFK